MLTQQDLPPTETPAQYCNAVGAAHIHGGGAAEGDPVLADTGTGG